MTLRVISLPSALTALMRTRPLSTAIIDDAGVALLNDHLAAADAAFGGESEDRSNSRRIAWNSGLVRKAARLMSRCGCQWLSRFAAVRQHATPIGRYTLYAVTTPLS